MVPFSDATLLSLRTICAYLSLSDRPIVVVVATKEEETETAGAATMTWTKTSQQSKTSFAAAAAAARVVFAVTDLLAVAFASSWPRALYASLRVQSPEASCCAAWGAWATAAYSCCECSSSCG